jgi:hypothetical protein
MSKFMLVVTYWNRQLREAVQGTLRLIYVVFIYDAFKNI